MKKEIKAKAKKMTITVEKTAYEHDFNNWIRNQVKLLKSEKYSELDTENLIEEIESLGVKDKRSLQSHTIILLLHLLKLDYQKAGKGNSNSWESSVLNARREIRLLLDYSPSLQNELIKILPKAYERARKDAAEETKLALSIFPVDCPWEINELFPFIKIRKSH